MPTTKKNSHRLPILLIGDSILDVHHHGAGGRISIEAPVPVGLHERTVHSWGGAGLVARNLLALGMSVYFFSVIGDDMQGRDLLRLKDRRLTKKFFIDKSRHTVAKERFLIHGKKALRWTRGSSLPISSALQARVMKSVAETVPRVGLILISDYCHGLMTKSFAQKIIQRAHTKGKQVWVDSQVTATKSNHDWYRGADLFCLNQKEAKTIDMRFDEKDLERSLKRLQIALGTKNVVVKLGDKGSTALFGNNFMRVPVNKVTVVDAVGAGDAFLAGLASTGALTQDALKFAGKWAALAVTVQGTEPPKRAMLK